MRKLEQRRCSNGLARRPAGVGHRQLRAGVSHAIGRAEPDGPERRIGGDAQTFTASMPRPPKSSAASACSRGGWSAACASSSCSRHTGSAYDRWDQHGKLKEGHAASTPRRTERPIAALLKDLKARGLLDQNAGDLGRRIRPHALRPISRWRLHQVHRTRSQSVRLHHVDGGRRREGRHGLRRDR